MIEPSISNSSPMVLVPKKDGSVRFCIDFCKLNKIKEFDAEPMPNMEELLIECQGIGSIHKWICVRGIGS